MKVLIEQDTIDHLPTVHIDGLSDDENRYVNEWVKYLLQYAKDNNQSNEVGIMLDKANWGNYDIVIGTERQIRFNTEKMLKWQDEGNDNLILIHNHPSDTIFSERDIFNFCKTQAVNTLIAAGNRGTIYLLQKLDGFNKFRFIQCYADAVEKGRDKSDKKQLLENTLQLCQNRLNVKFEKEAIV